MVRRKKLIMTYHVEIVIQQGLVVRADIQSHTDSL